MKSLGTHCLHQLYGSPTLTSDIVSRWTKKKKNIKYTYLAGNRGRKNTLFSEVVT